MKLKGLRQFGKELAGIVTNKKVFIPVIAILLIPVLYSSLFLGAFWDPYERLEELPVAIVNEDEGTVFNGKEMHIGHDFEEKLKENRTFNWDFVSKEEAMKGMADNSYYMAIEIPADFSKKTTTLTSETPEPAQLLYLPNESFNFLAGQIGNTAVEEMRGLLNKEVTEAYTRTVFEQLEEAADGIHRASDGAVEIAEGATKAKDGAMLLEQNMKKLANGAFSLQEGVNKLNTAGGQLKQGTTELNAGASKLANGLTELSGANGKLAESSAAAQQGASQLADGLTASTAGMEKLQAGALELSKGLEQLAQLDPQLGSHEGFQALVAASKQIETGLTNASAGQQKLQAGAEGLQGGLGKLTAGVETFGDKLNEAKAGASALAAGAGKLDGGASELKAGLEKLNVAANGLSDGTNKLKGGASEITSGLLKLDDGTHELSTKLTDASEQSAALSLSDLMVDMFADPIRLEVTPVTVVPNYGTGFAPYFLSLGLFVGGLLLTIVYTVREPVVKPDNGWSWFWSKALTLTAIGAIQALIADAALIFLLKMEVQNMPLFIMFSIITSITFMMIIQFLVTAFGNPGRFVAIVMLIFQLTSSAGTFPLELIPGWLQHVTPWLPMTYSVAGLKAVISSGDLNAMWQHAGMLIIFAAVFSALTLAYFVLSHRRSSEGMNDKQLVQA